MDNDETREPTPGADGGSALRRLHHHLLRIEDRSSEMRQRLDELGRGIAQARSKAMDDGLLPPDAEHRRPSFHDPNPGHDEGSQEMGQAPG